VALLLDADDDWQWPVDTTAFLSFKVAIVLWLGCCHSQVALVWFVPTGWKPCSQQ
jgi:hypothetical protein